VLHTPVPLLLVLVFRLGSFLRGGEYRDEFAGLALPAFQTSYFKLQN
jgi:hypothetical protein